MAIYDPLDTRYIEKKLNSMGLNEKAHLSFGLRLAQLYPLLKEKFLNLYHFRSDRLQALDTLIDRLLHSYLSRSSRLKAVDELRLENPDWFQSAQWVGMMLYVDRFCGDIPSLENKVDYLDELGINLIHLMPVLKSPIENNDGGYAISDYRNLDSRFGTIDDLSKLTAALRKQHKLLMFDMVINHTSDEHLWANEAKKGKQKYQEFYYMYDSRSIPDQFEQSMPQVFPEMAPGNFTFNEDTQKWVMTVFHNYQWDLNYTNPWVLVEMIDNMLFLLNCGIDIIRLDALAFIWKKIGTSGQNLPEAHTIIQMYKCCSQIVAPAAILLAEAIVAPVEIIKYLGQSSTTSNECDIAYNATLMTLLWESICTKNNKLLHKSLSEVPQKPKGTSWLNYVRCHDDIGLGYDDEHAWQVGYNAYDHRRFITDFLTNKISWSFSSGMPFMEDFETGTARISGTLASLAGLEKALLSRNQYQINLAIARINMLHSVILSYGGIPMIYSGDEIALLNDYSYMQDATKLHDNRWLHRPIFDWAKANLRNDSETTESRVFSHLKRLIKVRAISGEFSDKNNCYLIDSYNEHIFSFLRKSNVNQTLVVCNLNDHPEYLQMNALIRVGFDLVKGVRNKITDTKIVFSDHKVLLKPYEVYWITQ